MNLDSTACRSGGQAAPFHSCLYKQRNVQKWKFTAVFFLFFLCAGITILRAQSITYSGKIHDAKNVPVAGATISIKNTKTAFVTDANGEFSHTLNTGATLVITAVGFETKEVTVRGTGALSIELTSRNNSLDEVVVTALGIKREKRELTYSTQQVSGEQLSSSKESGVLNALTGKVAGVQITSSTGAPGASSRIVIRGNSSLLGNNEALIVLDGVPINNSQTGNAGGAAGNVSGISRLSDIDPSTIESINVLKGSAASALYGSDAARGVVVITTKGGTLNSKPKVELNSQYAFDNAILPKFQDKYAQGDRGVYFTGEAAAQKTSAVWGPLISDLQAQGKLTYNKDPLKEFFVTGRTLTNTVNVSGGGEKTGYFLSYSNLDQKGTVPTTNYKRNAFFAKFTTKITDKIFAGFQMNYTLSSDHSIPEGYDLTDPLWTLYTAPRTYNFLPYLDSAGNQRVFRASRNNPYWNLYNVFNNEKIARIIPTFSLTYNPVKWITVTERLGVDTYSEQADYYEAPSTALLTTGLVTQRTSNFRQMNNDLIAEARKTFKHITVSLLVGNNLKSTYAQTHSLTGTGTTILGYDNIANGAVTTGSESYSRRRKIGFFAQSNIGYKSFLNLNITGRYDGTSVLSEGNNFYPYGSASLGLVFSELLHIPAISFGKLRFSYSAVGNDNIDPYNGTTPFASATGFPYNGVSGFAQSTSLGNLNLVNEATDEAEVGLEMNFLQNRIGFEASYFDRKHKDLLAPSIPLAPSTGFSTTSLNASSMTNKGVEVLLNITPIKSKRFSWDVSFNYTKIDNKVTKVTSVTNSVQIGQTWAFVGDPYGVFYNYGYLRAADGQLMIDDKGLPIVTPGNVKIGNIQPDYQLGMTNTFHAGPFSVGFFLDYKKGGDVLNSDERYGFFYGTPKVTENRADRIVPGIVQSTKQPNTKSVAAEDYYQRINLVYEAAIQDATYLKLRYANISYRLPQKLLGKLPFSNASLTITGRNLFIYAPHFTGSDPEVSSYGTSNSQQGIYGNSVPSSRSFNFTLNLDFK